MFNNINTSGGQPRRQSRLALTFDSADKNPEISNNEDEEKKKAMHREIEKKRRQEMATLYSSLRSVLPLEFIRGKRSLADHMNEAVNYIKHLQTRIKALGGRRDELQNWWLSNLSGSSTGSTTLGLGENISSSASTSSAPIDYSTSTRVAVHPRLGGVEILISTSNYGGGSMEQGLLLSTLLKILLGQGLTVISCSTTQVNKRLIFTIQSEASDSSGINISGLQRILTEAVSSLPKVSEC